MNGQLDSQDNRMMLDWLEDVLINVIENTKVTPDELNIVFSGISYKGVDLGKYVSHLQEVYKRDNDGVKERLIKLKKGEEINSDRR